MEGIALPHHMFSLCPFKLMQPATTSQLLHKKSRSTYIVHASLASSPVVPIPRRSGNYQPTIWNHDFAQSLKSDTNMVIIEKVYTKMAEKHRDEVRAMFDKAVGTLSKLELIDVVQRIGVAYHFEKEIKSALDTITFNEEGASFLALEGEEILDEAQDFTRRHLKEFIKENVNPSLLSKQVRHALELPLHWRMARLETRWFIDVYEKKKDMNQQLLEFAKLDFNMVQATHQEDLKYASRWWRELKLGEITMSFARDRLVENFLWTIGVIYEPQFAYCRRQLAKINCLITTIDDVYDVYGSLKELELFTDAVERWDIKRVEKLPRCMKICFLALYNTTNQMVYDILREQGVDMSPYLKKAWADLCKAYLVEAEWYYNGYKPTLEEYLNNAWISISAPLILVGVYFFVTRNITKEALDEFENYTDLIRCSSMIVRLADDIGTSKDELERGDVPKSIQCYMHDTGASEETAREHIQELIGKTWKKMNKECIAYSPFPQSFISAALGLARMAQCMYQYGDGHGAPDRETKDRVNTLLIESIQNVEELD
ncbi:hypothetical protein GIB67_026816 [Kingdonia uniflora]|uniref:Uncharacterized protein n=1 Tax=Kingdonia uniflora TaxID=39325 RepID=A0A7J7MHV0_9MAGN|nr:hypothetical protein GIB67_026816 [Kingdonia uniflora]